MQNRKPKRFARVGDRVVITREFVDDLPVGTTGIVTLVHSNGMYGQPSTTNCEIKWTGRTLAISQYVNGFEIDIVENGLDRVLDEI